jgi:di/tricarboxylate transporter
MNRSTEKAVAVDSARPAPSLGVKAAGIIAAALVTGFILIAKPFSGLSAQGNGMIGVTLLGVSFWIFRPSTMPYLAGGSIILGGALLLGLPLSVVTSGYTSSAVWVLIPALYFGFVLIKTGLGKRIAYAVLKTFRPDYPGICISWFIIGLLLSALTPSITVRLAIVMPIAFSLVEACGLCDRSRGCALICFVAFGTALLPGIAWQTGSLWGIFMMGFFPPEVRPLATPGTWFQYMSFPWLLISILFVCLIYLLFKPKEPLKLDPRAFEEKYAALGRISKDEVVCAIVLIAALTLFSTDKWTGITTPEAALGALSVLMLFGIIKIGDIGTGVNWDIINFFGVVIGLSAMFAKAGVSDWIKPIILPGILSMAHSPLLLLLTLTAALWAIGFIDIPWRFTTFALLSPVFIPLQQQFGLHPCLVGVAFVAAGNSFFLAYQQPFIIMSDTMTKSRGWSEGQVSKAGIIYAVSVVIGICASALYWKALGLMP